MCENSLIARARLPGEFGKLERSPAIFPDISFPSDNG